MAHVIHVKTRMSDQMTSGSRISDLVHIIPYSCRAAERRFRDLNRSAANIPSACRIAIIVLNDAMILPYGANLDRMEFSERADLVGPFNRLMRHGGWEKCFQIF